MHHMKSDSVFFVQLYNVLGNQMICFSKATLLLFRYFNFKELAMK